MAEITMEQIEKALYLLQHIQNLSDPEAKQVLTHSVLSLIAVVDDGGFRPPAVAAIPTPTEVFESIWSLPTHLPMPIRNARPDPPKPKLKAKAAGYGSKTYRILEYLETFGDSGLTATELTDMVDNDLKPSVSDTLSYLKKTKKIKAVQCSGLRDAQGNERTLLVYYPLNGPMKPHTEDRPSNDHSD